MLIPSIDLQDGRAVQLRQGRDLLIDAGDPVAIAERFAPLGEIAVIDLDAARGIGDNTEVVRRLLRVARCRVGGGIRDRETAIRWLDAGAVRVIVGTAATPELLGSLPRDRTMAAVDAVEDEVVDQGWQRSTGESMTNRIERLRPFVGGFLATFVEHEGTGTGLDLARAESLRRTVGDASLVVAGGTRSVEEIARLDSIGIDVQVGRALYDGTFEPADAIAAMLRSDRSDGLWPTVVCDTAGTALGLTYSSRASLARALATGRGVYHSRRRGVWEKGRTSGAGQRLRRIDLDCDRDTLRFVVEQDEPGFCHEARRTCWDDGLDLGVLERRIGRMVASIADTDPASYTRRLIEDPDLLASKLVEEASELAADDADVVAEAADLTYFMLVTLATRGATLDEVVAELRRRSGRVSRRGGDAKAATMGGGR